jgi:hypothetical protein
LISNGRELIVDPIPGTDEALLRPMIFGPGLALLLRQRGLFTLHASSVVIQGTGVAFVGNTGWGKSTLAHAFRERGYPLVTDDLLAIDLHEGKALIVPGFPMIRLWPDSVAVLGKASAQFSKIDAETEKLVHYLSEGFHDEITPLKSIYILGKGEQLAIKKLATQEAFINVIAHSWGTMNLTERHFLEMQMSQCALLVDQVPVFRLERPKDLLLLPQICELILADLAGHELCNSGR